MTDNTSVILEKRGPAFWITINRPEKRNVINGDVVAGIAKGYRAAHADADVRLINEWAVTGEPFDARVAQAAGLVNHVAPSAELDSKIDWLIGRIVDKSPTAIRRGKYAMRAIASMSFDQSIAYTESQIALTAMTEDAKEGLKAFGEKRKPSWPGR